MSFDFDEKSGTVPAKTKWGQWFQSIEDVTIEIDVPVGVKSKEIKCIINTDNINVVVRNSTILQGKLFGIIVKDDSLWTLEDNRLLRVVLQKCDRNAANCWKSLLANNEYPVDSFTFQEMEKKLTLQRFQNEHPGMDFSKAEVTGNYHKGDSKLVFDPFTSAPYRLCPPNHFMTDANDCHPFFKCGDENLLKVTDELQSGFVKRLFFAQWKGLKMVYSVPRFNSTIEDFLHGITMLDSFQNTRFVPEIVGHCKDPVSPYLLTKLCHHGSADKLKDLLNKLNLSPRKEFEARVKLALDYLTILEFLHQSPIGTRVMCDSNDLDKTMSQYLITDDLHLVVADLDALPEVNHDTNLKVKCGHKQLYGSFIAPEQKWPFENETFDDMKMPAYDEKTDIWKIPNVLRYLLGQSNQSNQLKFHLFETLRLCKEIDPQLRPTARHVKEVFRKKMSILSINEEL